MYPWVRTAKQEFLGGDGMPARWFGLVPLSMMLAACVIPVVGPHGQAPAYATGKPQSVTAVTGSDPDGVGMPRDMNRCGPNALYLFLRLYGIPAEYGLILQRYMSAHPDGMSLTELRDACRDFGLPVQVRQCSISEMHRGFQSPVIALTDGLGSEIGHYVIVLSVRSDSALLLDGTTGRVSGTTLFKDESYKKGRLENIWRGYILVPTHVYRKPRGALAFSALLWLVVAGIIVLSPTAPKSLARQRCAGDEASQAHGPCRTRLPHVMVGVALACCVFGPTGKGNSEQTPAKSPGETPATRWRTRANTGLNCLYIQLRLLGYRSSYEAFRRLVSKAEDLSDLGSLARLAGRAGFCLVPRKLTVSELQSLPDPVLVHREDEGVDSGTFDLFLYGTETWVGLVEGASLRRIEIPADFFIRGWTGYALVRKPPIDWFVLLRRWGTVLLVGCTAVFLLRDHQRAVRPRG